MREPGGNGLKKATNQGRCPACRHLSERAVRLWMAIKTSCAFVTPFWPIPVHRCFGELREVVDDWALGAVVAVATVGEMAQRTAHRLDLGRLGVERRHVVQGHALDVRVFHRMMAVTTRLRRDARCCRFS